MGAAAIFSRHPAATRPSSRKEAALSARAKAITPLAILVGVLAFILVMILIAGDWYYVAGTFPCFASVFLWWIATGLDGYVPNGGGVGSGPSSLGAPATAGSGAFAGLLSTPWEWVWFD